MGSCREGYNLLHKLGRHCFWRDFKKGHFNNLVWEDTFNQFLCWIIGHDRYDSGEGGYPEWACKRCHQYIK